MSWDQLLLVKLCVQRRIKLMVVVPTLLSLVVEILSKLPHKRMYLVKRVMLHTESCSFEYTWCNPGDNSLWN